jgi:catechol 2,3-dioxygenase-like lactoylglutathione lyase family enzyme
MRDCPPLALSARRIVKIEKFGTTGTACRRFSKGGSARYSDSITRRFAMPESLPIESLNHVALTTRQLAQSRTFYRRVLGFREVERPNFSFAGAWLFNHGLMIHLIEKPEAPLSGGEIQTRENHVAFQTGDLGRVEQLLNEHGVTYRTSSIADTGIRQIFFQDPDGNHIEIGSYPPMPPFID